MAHRPGLASLRAVIVILVLNTGISCIRVGLSQQACLYLPAVFVIYHDIHTALWRTRMYGHVAHSYRYTCCL